MVSTVDQKSNNAAGAAQHVRQFVTYCAVGGVNTVVDFGTYFILTRMFLFWSGRFLAANVVAFFVANICSFFLNRSFTFKSNNKNVRKQYIRFVIVSLGYIALVQLLLYIGVIVLGFGDLIVKVFATAVGLVWNFFAHKFWSFGDTREQSDADTI